MVTASSLGQNKYSYGIEMDNLQGTLVQSKMVVRSARTNGLCTIKDADMRKPVLQAGLYTDISRESLRPGCWVAERVPNETEWTVGKVHYVVPHKDGKAVQLGVYYPGDTNGDATATVKLGRTTESISAKPGGCFEVRSTRPRKGGACKRGATGGTGAASMVFFKPDSLRYLDTEGAECLMSSVRVQGRALRDRCEQLDTRERLLVEHESQVQQALDGVSSERVAHAAHLATRERLLNENELKVQRALDHASGERIATATNWDGVKHAFHEHRERVQAQDVDSRRKHALKLQNATDRLVEANATIESHTGAAANGKALLAAEKANAMQANQRLANTNASLQAYIAKAGGGATQAQHVSEQRVAELNSTITELTSNNTALTSANAELASENAELTSNNTARTSTNAELTSKNAELATNNTALTSTNAELASENAELATNNEQQVRRVTLLQMDARDRDTLHQEERSRTAQAAQTERLRQSPAGSGARAPVQAEELQGSPHTGASEDAPYNMHTAASASTRDWNRSRDEKLKPLARGTRSSRELYQHQPQTQATASSHSSLAHDQFVESVMNHLQFEGAS